MTSGLLDTSVIIDWNDPAVLEAVPDEVAVSAISVAELAAGPHLASSAAEAASRQARLQEVESKLEPIPFDAAAARSYGQIVAAAAEAGRKHRRRVADLMIAATAHASGLALYTRNIDDFAGLERLLTVIEI